MAPKRSAIAPENGCAAPYSSVCIATDSANTSRPQPLAFDSGVRKKPSAERGPNAIIAMRQPQTKITAGVRQVNGLAAVRVVIMGISGAANIEARPPPPNQILCRAQPLWSMAARAGRYFAAGT